MRKLSPIVAACLVVACWGEGEKVYPADAAPDVDADTDSDSDADADGDTDSDTDSDGDTGSGSDSGLDTESCDLGVWVGDYEIGAFADIVALAGYTRVSGDLTIAETDLVDLFGLQCLQRIDGDLQINLNSDLTSLAGLDGLTTIDGGLHLAGNIALASLDGLESLVTIGADLHLGCGVGNPSLADIDALAGLESVGGGLNVVGSGLTVLDALAGIGSYGGYVYIYMNYELLDLDGLSGLTSIGALFTVLYNEALPTCAATNVRDQLIGEGWSGFACISLNLVDGCDDDLAGC